MYLIAHRGGRGFGIENTLDAMENAVRAGVRMIETDVRVTQDGKLMLCHDAVIWGHIVSKTTYDDLLKYVPERPLLSDVLDSLAGWVRFNFEIKDAPVRETGQLLEAYNIDDSVVVTSFDLGFLDEFKQEYPNIKTGYLYRIWYGDEQKIHNAIAAGTSVICPQYHSVNEELMEHAERHKLEVVPWTVNRDEDLVKLIDYGVHGIITDRYMSFKIVLDALALS
ncbi:MAG: glycerophosphodiester phosphodiesterase [Actinobacteria bacterium]|nr:glycerophosphodiester phosphodiesterase [Actinomycetota bacterium]